ncbi:hypothetical protein ASPVEDRAFT_306886 [Aspergillus versicolor CBS 583.65]|uniref:Zn(2)-C6 fungal-type domain-containing protein n=1 Tax=Aspergillus versicolor CBS 583.65 TaxID=1036611 RepID=A0A1L9P8B4_ASPVE|nr:uncharacterized protein ASPVEDRAFT_306886 [Aspergillus versicolor CBS 583.65]OJI97713.1 hypothetical protein ASPVEDRAFT_306886 [Aspergillus versicolor CBS 583.65]
MNDQESEKDSRVDHSPSRFTAVNGREAPVAVTTFGGSSIDGDGRDSTEAWPPGGCDPSTHQEEKSKENGNPRNDIDEQLSQRSTSHGASNSMNRSKRKRSETDEQDDDPYPPYRAPRSPVQPTDGPAEHHSQSGVPNGIMSSQSDTESKNTTPQNHTRLDEGDNNRKLSTNSNWHECDAQLLNQAQRTQQIDASDAQLAEALQRDAQGPDMAQKTWDSVNRPIDGAISNEQTAAPFPQDRPQNPVQIAPKRKRVFSNRTKTGCMTCRRRKKKCDEQHPACNNCIRGGFICEGYSSRSTWQKPSTTKTPVPLQSKEGYPDIGGQYVHDINQHDRQQSLVEPLEPGKMRPIIVDDETRASTQFNTTSPTGVGPSRGSWSKRTWPNASHPSYIADSLPKSDFREVPSIHELSRDGHAKSDYQLVPPIRELAHGGHTKTNVPLFQGGIDQRPAQTNSIDTSTPQAQARMALSIEHQLSGRAVSSEETEKDKMLRGDLYRPFDVLLVEERDRCRAALWRFNNACNPVSGLSAKEQNRLLKEILVPQPCINSSAVASPRPAGSIGQGAVVEAPFRCHYGYNIHIGEDVMVSESCLFVDDLPVSVGAHTWIGPRVTILTTMAHANMQERKGSQSRYQGRPVTIEEDCYVGAGCTIYPGVRLRRGAYVAPGEVVKSDIVAYGFQGLKPSYM